MKQLLTGDNIEQAPGANVRDQQGEYETKLLGVRFDRLSLNQAVEQIRSVLAKKQRHNLFFVNAHCLNIAFDNYAYRIATQQASLVFPDGIGVKLGCQLNDTSLPYNLNGTDLFPHICQLARENKSRVFLLGARPKTADKVAAWMQSEYPGIEIAGWHHGHFSAEENESVVQQINQTKANILVVAMGVPRQELWIHQHAAQLNTHLNIAVGGLFEFYSNNIPRAPLWLRSAHLEWVWRLSQEPRRLAKRYLLGSLLFLSRIYSEKSRLKKLESSPKKLAQQYHWWILRVRNKSHKYLFRLSRWWHQRSLRVFDIVVSAGLLLFLMPFLPLVIIAIKSTSPGPIFFVQKRVGIFGQPFQLIKFRSMFADAESRLAELQHLNEKKGGVMFKIKDDPRITCVGKFMRRFSVDELPQIYNVFLGDMSIVGPRPALYSEVEQYNLDQRERLDMKPGLTSEWVIAGRNHLSFEQQAQLDIEYYYQHSLLNNLKILMQTIPVVFSGRGAS